MAVATPLNETFYSEAVSLPENMLKGVYENTQKNEELSRLKKAIGHYIFIYKTLETIQNHYNFLQSKGGRSNMNYINYNSINDNYRNKQLPLSSEQKEAYFQTTIVPLVQQISSVLKSKKLFIYIHEDDTYELKKREPKPKEIETNKVLDIHSLLRPDYARILRTLLKIFKYEIQPYLEIEEDLFEKQRANVNRIETIRATKHSKNFNKTIRNKLRDADKTHTPPPPGQGLGGARRTRRSLRKTRKTRRSQ